MGLCSTSQQRLRSCCGAANIQTVRCDQKSVVQCWICFSNVSNYFCNAKKDCSHCSLVALNKSQQVLLVLVFFVQPDHTLIIETIAKGTSYGRGRADCQSKLNSMSFPFFIAKRVVQLYTMLVTMIAILLLLLGRTCHGATELPAPVDP